jgi:hypothetical protein
MIRGTTPRHTFTLPFDVPQGSEIRIVYAQGEDNKEVILFELTTGRCTVNGRQIQVKLKQEETLLFNHTPVFNNGKYAPLPVKIQIGVQTPGDDILWSNIVSTTVDRCLREDGRVCDG